MNSARQAVKGGIAAESPNWVIHVAAQTLCSVSYQRGSEQEDRGDNLRDCPRTEAENERPRRMSISTVSLQDTRMFRYSSAQMRRCADAQILT